MLVSANDKHRGFTSVESLAAATLLGFASVAIFPQVASISEWSRNKLAKQQIAQLNEVAERHFVDTGIWPVDLAELVTEGYLAAIPNHPDQSKRYQLGENHRVEVVSESCELTSGVRIEGRSLVGSLP